MKSRAALFKKHSIRNYEFERYLTSSEPNPVSDVVLDCTGTEYVITLPLSYFVSDNTRIRTRTNAINRRSKGKADGMPYESFRIINAQHRGGHAHSLILIKSHAIQTNPHHITIFESNGRNGFCGIRILNDHGPQSMKNVTKDYTSISPEYNINYGSDAHNPGYCGIYGIICIVAFRHYRSKTGTLWLNKWKKLLVHMSQCIDRNAGCLGVELAARVQEIIATTSYSCAERAIATEIRTCVSVKHQSHVSFIL